MKRKFIKLLWFFTLVFLGLYFFTPLGFHANVWVNRILSRNPEPVANRVLDKPDISGWKLRDLEGNTFYADQLEGKVALLNFWASWCPPCVAEMPSLDKLYQEYGNRVQFLFIARDQQDKVTAFLEKKGYDFPVYFESGLTPRALYYGGLPTTYIIDKSGQIAVAHSGAADWYSKDTRNLLDSLLTN